MDASLDIEAQVFASDSGEAFNSICQASAPEEIPSPRLSPIPESEIEEWVREAVEAEEGAKQSEA